MEKTLFILVILSLGDAQLLPQCQTNSLLPSDRHRLQSVPSNASSIPCDDVKDGWYRFSSGEIATSCVPPNQCGTISTIWMKDPVPNIGESRLNDFCVNHPTSSQPNPCCLFTMKINVTNCDGFLVYYFKQNEILCPAGYCRGDMKTCSFGRKSPTGFEPCTDVKYPLLYTPPVLTPPSLINGGDDFTQTCNIIYNGTSDATFNVTWLFDDVPYKTLTLQKGVLSASVTSADWKGHIGETLKCSVVAMSISTGTHSPPTESLGYKWNVRVQKTANIEESTAQTLKLWSTLPIVCPNISKDRCKLEFEIEAENGAVFMEGGCSFYLYPSQWDPVKQRTENSVTLATSIDPVLKDKQNFNITFKIKNTNLGLDDYYKFQKELNIQVDITDQGHQFCMAVGNAHFLPFTSTNTGLLGSYTGDYRMFKGASQDGRIVEVHVRAWRPHGTYSSICAVAFRYDDTLIKVDMCSSHVNMTAPVITQGYNNPEDVAVYLCSSTYEIVTGDDVRLSVALNEAYLDVKLHLSPTYTRHASGICADTRFGNRFSVSDKIKFELSPYDSLFQDGAIPFLSTNGNQRKSDIFCACGSGVQSSCSPFRLVMDPGSPIYFNKAGQMEIRPGCSWVTPHAANPGVVPLDLDFSSTESLHSTSFLGKCNTALQEHSNHYCSTHQKYRMGTFKIACEADLRTSNNVPQAMTSAVQGFHWYCQEKELALKQRYRKDSTGYLIPPAEVTSHMCSSVCSIGGSCHHGICACPIGLSGVDCSVNSTQPPELLGVKGGNTCVLSSKLCQQPILITRNIYASPNLKVLLNVTDLLSRQPLNAVLNLEPVYENKYSVYLPMNLALKDLNFEDKTVLHFTMRVTNDGKTFSNPIQYTVYDDKCQMCGIEHNCFQKENSCHIGGRCFAKDEVNQNNMSEICDPETSLLHWSVSKGSPSTTVNIPLVGK